MSDMITVEESNARVRAAISAAIEGTSRIAKEEMDAAIARAHLNVAETLRGLAPTFAGKDGSAALLAVASGLEATGKAALAAQAPASKPN